MIKLNFSNISPNEIFELMSVIDKDYPELFYIDIKQHPVEIITRRNVIEISISFIYDMITISKYTHKFTGIRNSLITHVANKSNNKAKLDCIYGSIVKSVVYSYGDITPMDYTISGPLLKHTGICEGYAKTPFTFLYSSDHFL